MCDIMFCNKTYYNNNTYTQITHYTPIRYILTEPIVVF